MDTRKRFGFSSVTMMIVVTMMMVGFIHPVQGQQYVLHTSVVSAGGTASMGSGYVLGGTLGQVAPGRSGANGFRSDGGFWPQARPAAGPVALPAAVADHATTDEDTAVAIPVLDNDTDPGGAVLSLTTFSQPGHGIVAQTGDNTLRYIPEADFFGEDAFSYSVTNAAGGSASADVTIVVNPVNDAPVFTSHPRTAAAAGQGYAYTVITADVDGDAVALTALALPPWLSLTDHGDGTATLEGTPGATEGGTHGVTLQATDGFVTTEQSFNIAVVVGTPAAPVLAAPEDAAENIGPMVLLVWHAVPGAASYAMQVATRDDFSELVVDAASLTDSTYTLTDLAAGTTYYWRVAAVNDAGRGLFSPPARFTTALNVAIEDDVAVPDQYELYQNYPNPFNPMTTIAFALPEAAEVHLAVYDLYGRRVTTLVAGRQAAGGHTVVFEAGTLASGTYFYRIEAGAWRQTKQLVVLK